MYSAPLSKTLDSYDKTLEHSMKCKNTRSSLVEKHSAATLLLQKSTRFHDKKTLDTQKNSRLQKQTYTQWKCENALQYQP